MYTKVSNGRSLCQLEELSMLGSVTGDLSLKVVRRLKPGGTVGMVNSAKHNFTECLSTFAEELSKQVAYKGRR